MSDDWHDMPNCWCRIMFKNTTVLVVEFIDSIQFHDKLIPLKFFSRQVCHYFTLIDKSDRVKRKSYIGSKFYNTCATHAKHMWKQYFCSETGMLDMLISVFKVQFNAVQFSHFFLLFRKPSNHFDGRKIYFIANKTCIRIDFE